MTPSILISVLFVCMFAFSVVFSMFGQGGGVLYTPIQVLFGINFHEAATTSLFLIMVTSLSATMVFRHAQKVDWSLAIFLVASAAIGGLFGGFVSDLFSEKVLLLLFSLIVALAAIFMIFEFNWPMVTPPIKQDTPFWQRPFGGQPFSNHLLISLLISFIGGAASGMVGVGGGIFLIPLMVLLLGVPIDIAIGSSAFIVGIMAAGGFVGHLAAGHWDWKTSLVLSIAVFLGGQIGARKAIELDQKVLKVAFGWLLIAIATIMAAEAIW